MNSEKSIAGKTAAGKIAEEKKEISSVTDKKASAVAEQKKQPPAKTAAAKKVEAKAAEKAPEEKKPEEKKTPAKKEETKKAPAKKTTVKKEPKTSIFVEFGDRQIPCKNVVDSAKKSYLKAHKGAEVKSVEVYIKPEEGVAYYVINGEGSEDFKIEL